LILGLEKAKESVLKLFWSNLLITSILFASKGWVEKISEKLVAKPKFALLVKG